MSLRASVKKQRGIALTLSPPRLVALPFVVYA